MKDVNFITKARTALVVPNAIEVVMVDGRRDFFTSFVSHDKARVEPSGTHVRDRMRPLKAQLDATRFCHAIGAPCAL